MWINRRKRIPVIAITGSSGKSTTKEMLASILGQKWRILKSIGNNNAPSHIRKLLQGLKPSHQACVLEFGASRPGMIARHCRIKQPTIGIITLLGTAHIGKFGGLSKLIEAKGELIRGMDPNGLLILNKDDPRTRLLDKGRFRGRTIYFGVKNECEYKGRNIRYAKNGMRFTVTINGSDEEFFIPIYGAHNVYNALAAMAAARELGFSVEHIRRGLARYYRMRRRLRVSKGINDVIVIDDSYSAIPEAVKAAIDVLVKLKKDRPAVAVLGGMADLGRSSDRIHRQIGHYIAEKRVSKLVTVGDAAKLIREGAIERGFPSNKTKHLDNLGKAVIGIRRAIPHGSVVLLKASHRYGFSSLVWMLKNKGDRPPSKRR
jgi:UDP-N-acetylmuramoyl-tripeptide--D-alanyl-D-alanine ligase